MCMWILIAIKLVVTELRFFNLVMLDSVSHNKRTEIVLTPLTVLNGSFIKTCIPFGNIIKNLMYSCDGHNILTDLRSFKLSHFRKLFTIYAMEFV